MRNSHSHENVDRAVDQGEPVAPAVRLTGLDAVRGAAMALGVILHACVPYLTNPLADLLWPVHDASPSPWCDSLFWWIHTFRLPLFFFLAGYFSEQLFQSRGPVEFARHRVARILVPYYVGLFTILPINLLVWSTGWVLTGRATWEQVLSPSVAFAPELQTRFFGPAHLWFLMDLTFITIGYGILRFEWGAQGKDNAALRLVAAPQWLRVALLAVPTAAMLWDDPTIYTGHYNSFVPHTVRTAYYAYFFLAGALAYRRRGVLKACAQSPFHHLLASTVPLAIVLWLVPHQSRGNLSEAGLCLFSCGIALTAWTMLLGLLGLAQRSRHDSPTVRYFADSSYWIYLCHLPLVGALQILLHPLPVFATVKMTITAATTLAVSLFTYEFCIRYTIVGRFLHGPRSRSDNGPGGSQSGVGREEPQGAVPAPHLPGVPVGGTQTSRKTVV